MRIPGRLIIDGEIVSRSTLIWLADQTTASLASHGVGPEAAVLAATPTGLPLIATVIAAERLGAAVILGETPPGGIMPNCIGASVYAGPVLRPEIQPASPAAAQRASLPCDSAAVFWTSGSTGSPKAVLLSQGALRYQAEGSSERLGVTHHDTWLVPLPLNHAYGFSILQMWLRHGPTLHLLSNLRSHALASHVCRPKTTMLDGVPGLYRILLRVAERDADVRHSLARLRLRGCGGDVLAPALSERFASVVGAPLHDGYGLTEAGPNVAVSAPGCHRKGTVGRALRGTGLRTVEATGELLVRGPGLMTCYLDDPLSTAAAFASDGWLRTGDQGKVDADGFVRITGRLKEVLIVQGESVAPSFVEQAMENFPGVLDVAVVGVRRPVEQVRGDMVLAYVVLSQKSSATVTALERACRAALPPGLRPRKIVVVDALPRLASGKVDRAALRRKAQNVHV